MSKLVQLAVHEKSKKVSLKIIDELCQQTG